MQKAKSSSLEVNSLTTTTHNSIRILQLSVFMARPYISPYKIRSYNSVLLTSNRHKDQNIDGTFNHDV